MKTLKIDTKALRNTVIGRFLGISSTTAFAGLMLFQLSAGNVSADTIYSELDDASMRLNRTDGTTIDVGPVTETDIKVGQSGSGLGFNRAGVMVFQLPDLGNVADPFGSAVLKVQHLSETVGAGPRGDVYGVARRASPVVQLSDYFGPGENDAASTLIETGFLVNGLPANSQIQSSAAGSTNLTAYLNAQYDGGLGKGEYVFIRINANIDAPGRWNLVSTDGAGANNSIKPQIEWIAATPPVDTIQLETQADGNGTVLSAENVTAGNSLTAYSISRDSGGVFLGSIPVTWSLENITGGIVAGDLVIAGDNKSATFTAVASGTADIVVNGTATNPILPLAITADPGPATQVLVETQDDGNGTVVAAQDLVSTFDTLTVYSIARDAGGNFVENIVSDTWTVENNTDEVVSGDLVAAVDNKSATFTASALGRTNIRATSGSLTPVDSGLITVIPDGPFWIGKINADFGNSGNWNVVPAFSDTTDLAFDHPDNTRHNGYLGNNRTVRSVTFTLYAVQDFNIRYTSTSTGGTSGGARSLTFDTDSLVDPAEIIVEAGATANFRFGNIGNVTFNYGNTILADNLLVTHNGSGTVYFDAAISETGGSKSITKAGTGTMVMTGNNTYTGDTTVNGGILSVNGSSLDDASNLIIDGGIVELNGSEAVGTLSFGAGTVTPGIYSAPGGGGIENANLSGGGLLYVGVPVPSGFVDWITGTFANGTVPGGEQGPNDDPDGDGISNLIEYAVDALDPTVANGSVGTMNGNSLSFDKRQPLASDITYAIEQSSDLGLTDSWEEVPAGFPYVNDGTTISYELPSGSPKDFMRLKVTAMP